jgi:guanylate kinase
VKGLLIIITAPSGAGKSSLINATLEADPSLRRSISYTTRPPRPGEAHGREYFFVDERVFLQMLGRAEFLESAQVHGNRYGTSQNAIGEALEHGHDLILEIDWQGAQQVRRLMPETLGIFILPPSIAELERRMRTRAQDTEEVIRGRLAAAHEELSHLGEFEYAIINNDFDEARRDLLAIIRAARLKLQRQLTRHPEIFSWRK